MANLFPKWTNKLPTVGAASVAFGAPLLVFLVWFYLSPWNLEVGYQPIQPVPYSHKLHAGLLGMDCRYCHNTVERAAHGAVPPTETCMNCHAQIMPDSLNLKLVRESFKTGKPIEWVNVHMLPEYAYFHHGVHLKAGVGCSSCHGRVDQMEIVYQAKPLSMGWCLECHRDPDAHIRPEDQVTNMQWLEDDYVWDNDGNKLNLDDRIELGKKLRQERQLNPPTHCSACHR